MVYIRNFDSVIYEKNRPKTTTALNCGKLAHFYLTFTHCIHFFFGGNSHCQISTTNF